jgi:hypothetical protein
MDLFAGVFYMDGIVNGELSMVNQECLRICRIEFPDVQVSDTTGGDEN